MTFCLETKIIEPDNIEKIDNAVILLQSGSRGRGLGLIPLGFKAYRRKC